MSDNESLCFDFPFLIASNKADPHWWYLAEFSFIHLCLFYLFWKCLGAFSVLDTITEYTMLIIFSLPDIFHNRGWCCLFLGSDCTSLFSAGLWNAVGVKGQNHVPWNPSHILVFQSLFPFCCSWELGFFFFFGQDTKIRIKHKCPQDEAHLQVLLARKTHPNSHNKATPGLSYLR